MKKKLMKKICLQGLMYSSILFFCAVPVMAAEQPVSISMPASILHQTLQQALPIPIETQKEYIDGDIVVESITKLEIGKNQVSLQGVLQGNNLSMNTNIAGQTIKLQLGSVRLPLSCDLLLRFDAQKKTLFVTPRFPNPETAKNADPAGALYPLLTALAGKEYPVALDSMDSFSMKIGSKIIPFKMDPIAVGTSGGMLIFQLKPRVIKKN